MTTQHQLRITTSTGEKYTSTPTPGSAAEMASTYYRLLAQDNAEAMISIPTTDGAVALRTRSIDAFHAINLPEEPDALADCGDEA